MAAISLQHVSKTFGAQRVVDQLDLEVAAGEFMVLLGPSGCGKSTTLRLIAGLDEPSEGRILIDGLDVTDAEPHQRGIAMVFQSYALYPHMTVRRNMSFGLQRTSDLGAAEIERRMVQAAERLRITELLDRKPNQLSGGQRQRVAIGRALVRQPKVFLFDEPLSNLDAKLRAHMRAELQRLHAELGITVIYVTHDQVEAMTLGTRVAVMAQGRIEQVGAPMEIYRWPASRFVASFIGTPEMNLLPVPESPDAQAWLRAHWGEAVRPGGALLGLRPEELRIEPATAEPGSSAEGPPLHWCGTVARLERLGPEAHVEVALGADRRAVVRVEAEAAFAAQDAVVLRPDPQRVRVFDVHGGQALARVA